jgi:hypothetical protein
MYANWFISWLTGEENVFAPPSCFKQPKLYSQIIFFFKISLRPTIKMNWLRNLINASFLDNPEVCTNYAENTGISLTKGICLTSSDSQLFNSSLIGNTAIINEETKFFVIFNGSRMDRNGVRDWVHFKDFSDLNVIFLIPDYRGFGEFNFKFSKDGANRDIKAACDFLSLKHVAKKIFFVGHSFGAAVALDYFVYASNNKNCFIPEKLFLLAPWNSLSMIIDEKSC